MPLRPQSAKSKGRRLQQAVARSILQTFPHLSADDCVSCSMGANGEDVRLSAVAREAVPLSIECKCVEKLNVWQCLEQAERNAPEGATPCLVFSRNRSPTYAVVPWPVLLDLYRTRAQGGGAVPPRLARLLRDAAAMLPPESPASPPRADEEDGDEDAGESDGDDE